MNTQPDTHHARRDLLEQLRDPTVHSGSGQPGSIQTVAPSFGVELRPVDVRDAGAFARSPNGGLIVTGSRPSIVHRDLIITLAARTTQNLRCA